jgi:hypothetical protein
MDRIATLAPLTSRIPSRSAGRTNDAGADPLRFMAVEVTETPRQVLVRVERIHAAVEIENVARIQASLALWGGHATIQPDDDQRAR